MDRDRRSSRPRPVTTSTWWYLARRRGARWGVVVLWILGAVLSYSALRRLALMVGFPEFLADLWPLVIDVAVWVGAMNALEAAADGRQIIERYAWVLVGLFSAATVAGNALVAGTEPVDPRMLHALGDPAAHWVSQVAHAAPAVTMILFAHLAGLLVGGRPQQEETVDPYHEVAPGETELREVQHPLAAEPSTEPSTRPIKGDDGDHRAAWSWPSPVPPSERDRTERVDVPAAVLSLTDGRSAGHGKADTMTAVEARRATVLLVRRARVSGSEASTADIQRLTGRSARQARRLLRLAMAEVTALSQS
jgi:Protein of unknown function (DUF2637)